MFYYLSGTVAAIEPQLAVIDCGGVGFACSTTTNTISHLNIGKPATLYTHVYIREDALDIYGFASKAELNCFRLLIGVSGVGPKAALSILSAASPEDLSMSILTGNEKMLTVAPGIGKKIAQRIILELKDKLNAPESVSDFGNVAVSSASVGKVAEAQAALGVLGYSGADITNAMRGIDTEELSVEDIIRQALKKMIK